VLAGALHQYDVGFDSDRILFYISIGFAIIHLVVFGMRLGRPEPVNDGEPKNPLEDRI
jgi:hypothetical protein